MQVLSLIHDTHGHDSSSTTDFNGDGSIKPQFILAERCLNTRHGIKDRAHFTSIAKAIRDRGQQLIALANAVCVNVYACLHD